MTPDLTFDELARRFAEAGAASSCAAQACVLDGRAELEPPLRAAALRAAARGLRVASRILWRIAPSTFVAAFRPVGMRGAVAAGHVALAAGLTAHAEAVGAGICEAVPESPAGPRLVGEALFAQRKFRLAARALRRALGAAPDDWFTRALHAEALWFAGERTAARAALAELRAWGGGGALAAALHAAIESGALDGAGGTRCA